MGNDMLNIYRPGKHAGASEAAHCAWRANLPGAWVAWTDGACEPNPGWGGWGVSIVSPDGAAPIEDCGGERETTNNRMELLAIIEALRRSPRDAPVVVCTDSQLCLLCAVGRWKRKTNLDLWAALRDECEGRVVVFEWHRGHVGTIGNERADELASMGRLKAMQQ